MHVMRLFEKVAGKGVHWWCCGRLAICLIIAGIPRIGMPAEAEVRSPRELVQQGMEHFRAGRVAESIQSFEAAAKLNPKVRPQLWQLGISYYYAGEYSKGQQLFESHQKVNPQDVENAVWHFSCVAKQQGPEAARAKFIAITDDPRVPMKEVHRLFAGKGTKDEVMEAAKKGNPDEVKDRMFYACLYLGLYEEAMGNAEESLKWIRKAAGEFAQSHYMGDVARIHLKQREKTKQ
jgi:lipoprotein NlpI